MVLVNFWRYPDLYQRFLIRIRIRIRPNDTDPTGSGSETLICIIKKMMVKASKQSAQCSHVNTHPVTVFLLIRFLHYSSFHCFFPVLKFSIMFLDKFWKQFFERSNNHQYVLIHIIKIKSLYSSMYSSCQYTYFKDSRFL